MTTRQLRALRGASASAAATVIAAVSHTLGGGSAPAPALVIMMAVIGALPAMALMGDRMSLPRLVATVLTSQVGFHAAFAALGSPVAGGARLVSAHAAHAHAAHAYGSAGELGALIPVDAAAAAHVAALDPAMLFAHALSAVLTIAVLRRGEHAVRAVTSWVVATLLRVVPAPASSPRPASFRSSSVPRVRAGVRLLHVRTLRGPPPSFAV